MWLGTDDLPALHVDFTSLSSFWAAQAVTIVVIKEADIPTCRMHSMNGDCGLTRQLGSG